MSKKPYDLSKLENELKGASSFFKSPAAAPISTAGKDLLPATETTFTTRKETPRSAADDPEPNTHAYPSAI